MRTNSLGLVFALLLLVSSAFATNPNPCIQSDSTCSEIPTDACVVSGVGNSVGDLTCRSGGCHSDADCNYRGSCNNDNRTCSCIGLWTGDRCEVLNRCNSDYTCRNGGTCVASTIYDQGFDGIDPTYSYVCENCNAGSYPPTCGITDPSQVVWAEFFDRGLLGAPDGYDREFDLCGQDITPVACTGNVVTSMNPGESWPMMDYTTANFTIAYPPLDFSFSSALNAISLDGTGFGVQWSYFSLFTANYLTGLTSFTCEVNCHVDGDVSFNAFPSLNGIFVVGALTSFTAQPYNSFDQTSPLSQINIYLTPSVPCTMNFALSDHPNMVAFIGVCASGVDTNGVGGDCSYVYSNTVDSDNFFGGGLESNYYPNLLYFQVSNTNLGPTFPSNIMTVAPNIFQVYVAYSGLSGSFPLEIFTWNSRLGYLIVLSGNSLTGQIPQELLAALHLGRIPLLAIDNNNLTGPFPQYPNYAYYANGNDWICGPNMIDSSGFNYTAACNVTGPCANFTTNCTANQGYCNIISGGCHCYSGFFDAVCVAEPPALGCALDSQSYHFESYLNSVRISNPTDYDYYTTNFISGRNCKVPVCDWVETVASIPTHVYKATSDLTESVAADAVVNRPALICDPDRNIVEMYFHFPTSTSILPPDDLSNWPSLQYFQYYAPSTTAANLTDITLFMFNAPSTLMGLFFMSSGIYDNLNDFSLEKFDNLLSLRIQNIPYGGNPLPQLTFSDNVWQNLTNIFYVSLNGFGSHDSWDGLGPKISNASSLYLLDLTPQGSFFYPNNQDNYVTPRDSNQFAVFGTVDSNLFEIPSLNSLYLGWTGLQGTLPPTMSGPTAVLSLLDSDFYGTINKAGLDALHPWMMFISGTNFTCPEAWDFLWGPFLNDSAVFVANCQDKCLPSSLDFLDCSISGACSGSGCVCQEGWKGTKCNQQTTGVCSTASCDFAHSYCVNSFPTGYHCVCDIGYFGEFCTISVDTINTITTDVPQNFQPPLAPVYPEVTGSGAQLLIPAIIALAPGFYFLSPTSNNMTLGESWLDDSGQLNYVVTFYASGSRVHDVCTYSGIHDPTLGYVLGVAATNPTTNLPPGRGFINVGDAYFMQTRLHAIACTSPDTMSLNQFFPGGSYSETAPSGGYAVVDFIHNSRVAPTENGFNISCPTSIILYTNPGTNATTIMAGSAVEIYHNNYTAIIPLDTNAIRALAPIEYQLPQNPITFTVMAACYFSESDGTTVNGETLLIFLNMTTLAGDCDNVECDGQFNACSNATGVCECNEGWGGNDDCGTPITYNFTADLSSIQLTQNTNASVLIFSMNVNTTWPFYVLDTANIIPNFALSTSLVTVVQGPEGSICQQTLFFFTSDPEMISCLANPEVVFRPLSGFVFWTLFDGDFQIPDSLITASIGGWFSAFPHALVGTPNLVPTVASFVLLTPASSGHSPAQIGDPIAYTITQGVDPAANITGVDTIAVTITALENDFSTIIYTYTFPNTGYPNATFTPRILDIASYPGVALTENTVTFYYAIQVIVSLDHNPSPSRKRSSPGYSEGDIVLGNGTYYTSLQTTTTTTTAVPTTTTAVHTTTSTIAHTTTATSTHTTTHTTTTATHTTNTTTATATHTPTHAPPTHAPTTPSDGSNTVWKITFVTITVVVTGLVVLAIMFAVLYGAYGQM